MKETFRQILIVLTIVLTSCQSLFPVSHVTPAPTPQCVEPTLTLGTLNYRIESLIRQPNTFPEIPQRKNNIAYWIDDTITSYVFALSPTRDNLALNTVLKAGEPMIINWADCSKDEYVIKSIDTAQSNDLGIFDQSTGGLIVYVQTEASTLLIQGERPIVQPAETAVPTSANATQLDIQFSDLTLPDDQSVKIGLSITNQGTKVVTLTDKDISLTTESGPETLPLAVEPALPQDIQPGGNLSIAVTFPKPQASSAVLRILDTTLEYFFQ